MTRFATLTLIIAGIALTGGLYSCVSESNRSSPTLQETTDNTDQNSGENPPTPYVLPEVPQAERQQVSNQYTFNAEAPVPPQCYTKTDGQHNPCYTCHQVYSRENNAEQRMNFLDDGYLQGSYEFSEVGVTNHWANLFVDRNAWLESVTDEGILDYIEQDNYSDLPERLQQSGWTGFVPDLRDYPLASGAFDAQGLALDGSHWVAFNYKPFPGTFWPTNGSTDDVLIRLPAEFRQLNNMFDKDIYYINLTLVELNIKNLESTTLWPVDETRIGADIDQNGVLNTTSKIVKGSSYVGDASTTAVMFQQFPSGAELMHSVRYVGVGENDSIHVPRRMKELRYMRKVAAYTYQQMDNKYWQERKEKFLGQLPSPYWRGDEGFDNALGWYVQGFIEDYDGSLRAQSREENLFCMGCHKNIGTTLDSTFSFGRKVTGGAGWGYINLKGMPDVPSIGENENEILSYLRRVGGGSEFRENPEMFNKWFTAEGEVDSDKVRAADVYTLVAPSRERALALNKAYSHIVRHQSFIHGRDATWQPAQNVISEVTAKTVPLENAYRFFGWELRLDWNPASESQTH